MTQKINSKNILREQPVTVITVLKINRTNVLLKSSFNAFYLHKPKCYVINYTCRTITTLCGPYKKEINISLKFMMSNAGPKSPQTSSMMHSASTVSSQTNIAPNPFDTLSDDDKKLLSSPLNNIDSCTDSTYKVKEPLSTTNEEKKLNPQLQDFASESSKPLQHLSNKIPLNKKIEGPSESESTVIKESLANDVLTVKHSGELGLGVNGIELLRYYKTHKESLKQRFQKTPEDVTQEAKDLPEVVVGESSKYTGVTVEVHSDTSILLPHQSHTVITKGDPDVDDTVAGIAYLTSQKNVVKSNGLIEVPPNIKISDTQPMSGKNNPQFVVPIKPVLIISSDNCKTVICPQLESLLQEPKVVTILDTITEQASEQKPIKYNTKGLMVEDLQDLNDLNKLKNQSSTHEEID